MSSPTQHSSLNFKDSVVFTATESPVADSPSVANMPAHVSKHNIGSPRQSKVEAHNTGPKHPHFTTRNNRAMDPHCVEITWDRFMKAFAPGRLMSETNFRKVKKLLDPLAKCNKETEMYPILVSIFSGIS